MRAIEDKAFQERVRQQCVDAVETDLMSAVPTVMIGDKRRQIGMVLAEAYWQDLAAFGVE